MNVCMAVLLNLSNQQIANFFHIEVKTIEEYIRRIRRKLQLEQRANLKAYLLLWTK
jgi:DNA-binding NarL/FixJ family response regulator